MAAPKAKVLFKFNAAASKKSRKTLIAELDSDADAESVRRLFEDVLDGELADIYVVSTKRSANRLIDRLQKSPIVEYAEAEPVRGAR